MNKTLKLITIVLFIVIVAELAYFLSGFYKQSTNNLKQEPVNNDKEIVLLPQDFEAAFNFNLLDILKTVRKDAVVSSELTLVFQGTITSIDVPEKPRNPNFRAKISYRGQEQIHNIYFDYTHEIPLVEVYEDEEKIENKILLSDLKVGNRIKIIEILDITLGWPKGTKSIKIIKT